MRLFWLTAGTLTLLYACVSDTATLPPSGGEDAGRDASVDDAAVTETSTPDASLATLKLTPPPPLQLRQGASLDVTVDFERNGVTGPIALTATGQGNGTTIVIAPIADGSLTTQMKITTAANADVGSVDVTLKAPGVAERTFPLIVAGPSGALDVSFDTDGIVLDTSQPAAAFNGVATQPDGKIVVVGTMNTAANKWLVRRYNADGSPDSAFNQAVSGLPASGVANAVAIDPKGGRIVIVGDNGTQTAVVRLNASGAPDQSFDGDGSVATNPVMNHFGSANQARALAVLADSSILVAGSTGSDGYVIHFDEAGAIDENFNRFFLSDLTLTGSLNSVFAVPNGIFATGGKTGGAPTPMAVRLQTNGKPDLNFGGNGSIVFPADGCSAGGAGIATNDDVMILGKNLNAGLCAVRTTPNGTSSVYGIGGGSVGQPGGATAGPDESFYVDGWYGGSQDRKGFVHRRMKNGTLDPTFAVAGEAIFEDTTDGLPDAFTIAFRAIATQRDGRIVAAGARTGNSNPGPIIYRLWP